MKLLVDRKAQMIYTDPPYNVAYDAKSEKTHGKSFNDSRSNSDFSKFLGDVFMNAVNHLEDSGVVYCWHASKTEMEFRKALEDSGVLISETLYWLKNNATFSRSLDYLYITEPCYFGWKKGNKHYKNKLFDLGFTNVDLLGMEDFQDLLNVIYAKRDDMDEYEHPTQKPVSLAKRPIIRHSRREDIVLDMFGGSGSTLLCCDQRFCDVIRRRYAKAHGVEDWEGLTKKAEVV